MRLKKDGKTSDNVVFCSFETSEVVSIDKFMETASPNLKLSARSHMLAGFTDALISEDGEIAVFLKPGDILVDLESGGILGAGQKSSRIEPRDGQISFKRQALCP